MAKQDQKKRFKHLLSAEEIPTTTPEPPTGKAKEPPAEAVQPTVQEKVDKDSLGWQDFLNAIDRDETLGFAFEQETASPSKAAGVDPVTANALLKIGEEIFGKVAVENEESLPPEAMKMLDAVAQQVSQHVENLRLLEQAEQYRADAEKASRQLTQEGWDEYLNSPHAPARGYTYDHKRVTTTNEVETITDPGNVNVITQVISVRDEPIGRLVLEDVSETETLIQKNEVLEKALNNLSAHIENLRLLEETERSRQQLDKRAAELETVAKVSTAAAAIQDPEALLRAVVDLTNFSFGLYHTSIHLLEENETGETMLKLVAASGKRGYQMIEEGHIIPLDEKKSLIAGTARKMEAQICSDAKTGEVFFRHHLLPDTRSELAVPMVVADRLLGIFDVQSETPNRFSDEDKRTYNTLASQTAVALQNALLYQEQIKTVERLRELDHLKSSFLANMSHELRTPLNSISGFTQVLLEGLDGELTPEMQDDLGLIEKNANHLLNLINEVLDMAKIEAGRLSVSVEPINLYEIIEDVVKSTAGLARENNLKMELDNRLDPEQIILIDGMRIQQVMINLIGNAMKFTQEGGITVRSRRENNLIRIEVSDTGIGIPPDQLEMIFEAFSQVDTSTTRKTGGTGLGLPISKRFIELHNGRLWAESSGQPGEGSVFIIELPIILPQETEN